MTRKHSRILKLLIPLGLVIAFIAWYCVAADYDYGALSGTYVYRDSATQVTLTLKADHSFHMESVEHGQTKAADGIWRRIGEGGVSFSAELLRVPGAKTYIENFGKGDGGPQDNEFYGHFSKVLGVYPELRIDPQFTGPVLHRKLF